MLKLQKFMKTKKGFTLVEVIVVLVILAILAAISIPALTGYIDEAKKKQIVAETRTVLVAMQAVASDEYKDGATALDVLKTKWGIDTVTTGKVNTFSDTSKVSQLIGETPKGTVTEITVSDKNRITAMTYTVGSDVCKVANGKVDPNVEKTPKP
ncbi:MAG: prepilin-type N-terminal cleavage/methylation domain-containing protein [Hydrogenoanaerobacterium sp.]